MKPVLTYLPSINFNLPQAKYYQSQLSGACWKCGDWFEPFVDEFYTDAGLGCTYHVKSDTAKMCPRCFAAFKASRKDSGKPAPKKDVYYQYAIHARYGLDYKQVTCYKEASN